MRKYCFLIALLFIAFAIIAQNAFSQEIDALEQAYKQQFKQLTDETYLLKSLISAYGDGLSKLEAKEQQSSALDVKMKYYEISRKDYIQRQIEIKKECLQIAQDLLRVFNAAKNQHREDFSVEEIQRDQEYSQRRLAELADKKQDLKIKLLEKKGALPSWWID